MSSSPPPSPWPRRGLLLLASLVGAALLGEVGARLLLPHEWDTERLREELNTFHLGTLTRFSADPALYFELEPGLAIPDGRGWVYTDAQGHRIPGPPDGPPDSESSTPAGDSGREPDSEPHSDEDPAPARLAVLGDSTCFGWRLPFERSYPELLRRRLEEAWERPVELTNWCVPAYNTEQEVHLFTDRVLATRPDLVLWHYDHNDVVQPLDAGWRVGMPPEWGDNPLGSALVKVVRRRWRAAWTREQHSEGGSHGTLDGYVTDGPSYTRHLQALERMAAAAREARTPVLLVIFDAGLERGDTEHFERLHRGLRGELERIGQPYLDLHDAYQEIMARKGWDDLKVWWLSRDRPDAHPNRFGHAFIADTLADHLLALPGVAQGPPLQGL